MLRQDPAQAHIAELDGLRALAVVPVIAFHFGANLNGPAGVTVFFALSGFIVTTVLLREYDNTDSIRLRSFYTRRFRRLLPAATLVVAATVVVGWILSKPPIVREGFASLTYWADIERFTSTYHYGQAGYAPLEHFWSLAIEEQFYLVLPLACVLLLRFGRTRFAFFITAATMASVMFAQAGRGDPLMYFHPAARVCELLVGVLLAVSVTRLHTLWGYAGLAVLITILTGAIRPVPIITAAVTCVVIAGLPRILALRPLVVIGRYSYGLYLWHPLAAVIATRWPVRVALAVAFSVVCYHVVESPIRFKLSVPRAFGAMTAMSVAGLAVVVVPFNRLTPNFSPVAPVVAAPEATNASPHTVPNALSASTNAEVSPTTTIAKRPLRISGAGDSTQMFLDGAWQAFAAAHPDDLTWVTPPADLAIWTSGADSWIRTEAPKVNLSLPHDGPQGGIDRQGCPLIYDLNIRAVETMRFSASDKLHSATPIATCDWHLWIPQALAAMHLDVLVVSWGVTSMWEYEMPDGVHSHIGNPDYDALMTERMTEFEQMAASYGTKVLWTTYVPKQPDTDAARWTYPEIIDALASLIMARPCAADLRPLIRDDPSFHWYQDGYHFTPDGAARAVAAIAPSIQSCDPHPAAVRIDTPSPLDSRLAVR
jgi:peptidoglycan/LPS O-acetylase OafA/YrhL